MLYREIIAVCSQIHTKHINTLCGQNVELLNIKLVVYIVTTGNRSVSFSAEYYSKSEVMFLTVVVIGHPWPRIYSHVVSTQ